MIRKLHLYKTLKNINSSTKWQHLTQINAAAPKYMNKYCIPHYSYQQLKEKVSSLQKVIIEIVHSIKSQLLSIHTLCEIQWKRTQRHFLTSE